MKFFFSLLLFLSLSVQSHADRNTGAVLKKMNDKNGGFGTETSLQKDNNGTVIDTRTGLQWQDDYSGQSGKIRFSHYMESAAYCSELILNGTNDWRLPSKDELLDLFRKSDSTNEKIFVHSAPLHYWSNTPYPDDAYYNLVVNFRDGRTEKLDPWYAAYVRCVREYK